MTHPIGLITDIHANWPAFDAVLSDIKERGIKEVWFLGDVIDFGPWPVKCLEIVTELCGPRRVLGNHDLAVAGIDREVQVDKSWLPVADWTTHKLGKKGIAALMDGISLTAGLTIGDLRVSLAHAMPVVPPKVKYGETTPYVYAGTHKRPETQLLRDISAAMVERKIDVAAYGHTHIPFIYTIKPGMLYGLPLRELLRKKLPRFKDYWYSSSLEKHGRPREEYAVPIERGKKIIVNVPACGQPRDNDPRTGYAIISEKEVRIVRLTYDIDAVINALAMSGMPVNDKQQAYLHNFLHYGDSLPTHSQAVRPGPRAEKQE
jgi:predicted phosphodiesterase